ncbi:uncharacterized protein LOC141656647 isoform X1 [Silene latifolia]|uniref:uncharacterized protein LOC141656647 isoform X1 n=1 Tax=Silene latifolia TaxID=37657 RepID=UPI003D77D231
MWMVWVQSEDRAATAIKLLPVICDMQSCHQTYTRRLHGSLSGQAFLMRYTSSRMYFADHTRVLGRVNRNMIEQLSGFKQAHTAQQECLCYTDKMIGCYASFEQEKGRKVGNEFWRISGIRKRWLLVTPKKTTSSPAL